MTPLPSLRPRIGPAPATRKVDKLSTIRWGSARYSAPKALVGAQVAVIVDGARVLLIDPATGVVHAEHAQGAGYAGVGLLREPRQRRLGERGLDDAAAPGQGPAVQQRQRAEDRRTEVATEAGLLSILVLLGSRRARLLPPGPGFDGRASGRTSFWAVH